ncbi:MAG: hypothetical protein NVSMB52_06130 [Chloroflexota bacterium]
MSIRTKRASDPMSADDGTRVLVDRYWPRGIREEDASIDKWARAVAPSPELIAWYGHKRERWAEFKKRYFEELSARPANDEVQRLTEQAISGSLTLIFGTRDREHNAALALAEYLHSTDPDLTYHSSVPFVKSRPPRPGRLRMWLLIADTGWLWLAFALAIPILILIVGYLLIIYGTRAWLVLASAFFVLTISTLVRVTREEHRARATEGAPQLIDRAPLWGALRELSVETLSFVAGCVLLLLIVAAFMQHAGYFH